eukprot:scaffold5342_cov83-Skeletonema_menzelii.AAC.1
MADPFTTELLRLKTADLPPGHWLPPTITVDNAWLCLTTTANGDNTAEFSFVMAFIVNHQHAVFDSAGFSIAGHDYRLLARAFSWMITEFEAFGRLQEARRAAAAQAEVVPAWHRDRAA